MKQNKECYYCGAPATSLEHAPPKQFFKGFPCDSITVPSCDEHNTFKSSSDQAIVTTLLLSLDNCSEKYALSGDILKAIEIAKPSFPRAKKMVTSAPLISDLPSKIASFPDLAHLAPDANIRYWVVQLTAALVYDAIEIYDPKIKWDEVIALSPNWVETDTPSPKKFTEAQDILAQKNSDRTRIDELQWYDGWSAHPRIYPQSIFTFRIHFADQSVLFHHNFYGSYSWYVQFPVTRSTRLLLIKKIESSLDGTG